MKFTKSQLKNIIKEELESVLGEERPTDRFQNMISAQFNRAKKPATVEKMAHYYDEMVAMAAERAPLNTSAPLEIADALARALDLDRESAYWSWARRHLQHLVGLPREVIDALPPSAAFAPAAMERIEDKERQVADRPPLKPMSPEKFGAKMSRGDYGRLD